MYVSTVTTYLKGSVVPSLVLIILVPLVVYKLVPPEVKATPWAPKEARQRLSNRGRMSWQECVMAAVLLGAVALWVSCAGPGSNLDAL
jgi:DASS family divalent anion:Na+ symporter